MKERKKTSHAMYKAVQVVFAHEKEPKLVHAEVNRGRHADDAVLEDRGDRPNVGRLVLGCIAAKCCK